MARHTVSNSNTDHEKFSNDTRRAPRIARLRSPWHSAVQRNKNDQEQEDETQEQGKTTRWRHGAGYLEQKRDHINMTEEPLHSGTTRGRTIRERRRGWATDAMGTHEPKF